MSQRADERAKWMAYVEGELGPHHRESADGLVEQREGAEQWANELAVLRGHVVELRMARQVAAFDVADAVMARVVFEQAKERRSKFRAARGIGLAVFAAVAVAAGVAGFVTFRERVVVALAPGADSSGGVEIEADQSSEHAVSVYYVPNGLASTVVLWVDESVEAGE